MAMIVVCGFCIIIAPAESCLLAVAAPQYAVLSILAAVVFGLWIRARLERRPLASLARKHNLSRNLAAQNTILDRFADLELLRRGHCRQILDVLSGTVAAREFTCFRFLTELGARSQRRLDQYVVVALELSTGIQDIRIGRDGELATSLGTAALVDLSEPRPRERAGPAACCYMTPADQVHSAAGLLIAWMTEQPEGFAWQVTPGVVAGFAGYPATAERIEQLIQATCDFIEVVIETPSPNEPEDESH
jgi:hypothetical protein